jgi:hypothetical protein
MIKYYRIFNDGITNHFRIGSRMVIGHIVDQNVWVVEPTTLDYGHITIHQWKALNPQAIKHDPVALLNTIERNLKHSRQVSFIVWCRDQLMLEVNHAKTFKTAK